MGRGRRGWSGRRCSRFRSFDEDGEGLDGGGSSWSWFYKNLRLGWGSKADLGLDVSISPFILTPFSHSDYSNSGYGIGYPLPIRIPCRNPLSRSDRENELGILIPHLRHLIITPPLSPPILRTLTPLPVPLHEIPRHKAVQQDCEGEETERDSMATSVARTFGRLVELVAQRNETQSAEG